jgi:transposase
LDRIPAIEAVLIGAAWQRCRVHWACKNHAFAALGGVPPLPASSGRTVRHRLNRSGDRALNRAIHTIALIWMRNCPTTRAYVARRTAQGKTHARSDAASSDTSPASSTASSPSR